MQSEGVKESKNNEAQALEHTSKNNLKTNESEIFNTNLNLNALIDEICKFIDELKTIDSYSFSFLDLTGKNLFTAKMKFLEKYKNISKYRENTKKPLSNNEITVNCFHKNEIININKKDSELKDFDPLLKRLIELFEIENCIFMPISKEGEKLGVLSIINHKRSISNEDILKVEKIIDKYFNSLLTAREITLFKHKKDKIYKEALYNEKFLEIANEINNIQSADNIYKLILNKLLKVTKYDIAFILLEKENTLKFIESVSFNKTHAIMLNALEEYINILVEYKINPPNNSSAEAMLRNTHLYFEDIQPLLDLPMSDIDRNALNIIRTPRSIFVLPVLRENKPAGIIQLYTLNEVKKLDEVEINFLKSLGSLIGSSISNAQLYSIVEKQKEMLERTKNEIESISKITKEISMNLDFDSVYLKITQYLNEKYGFEGSFLSLVDENNKTITIQKIQLPDRFKYLEKEIIGKRRNLENDEGGRATDVIKNNKSNFILDLEKSGYENIENKCNRHLAQKLKIKSILHLPILLENRAIGSLSMMSFKKQINLKDEDIKSIERFVDQIAILLKNSKLFEEIKKKSEEIENVNEITNDIALSFDFESVFNKIVNYLNWSYNFESVILNLVNDDKTKYYIDKVKLPEYISNIEDELIGLTFDIEENSNNNIVYCITHNDLKFIENVEQENKVSIVNSRFDTILNFKSILHMPVNIGEEVIGVLSFFTHNHSIDINNIDVVSLKRFVNQIAIILRNSKMYEEIKKKSSELEKISEISRELSTSLDYKTVFDKSLKYLFDLFNIESSNLYIVSSDKKYFYFDRGIYHPSLKMNSKFSLFINTYLESIRNVKYPLEENMGWIAESILKNKIIYETDIIPSKITNIINRKAVDFLGIKTILILPIRVMDEIIGILSLTSHTNPLYFSDEDINSIKRYVSQIAVILRNSRLYEEIQNAKAFSDSLLSNSPFAIQVLNPDGFTVYFNSAAEKTLDVSRGDIIYRDFTNNDSVKKYKLDKYIDKALKNENVYIENHKFKFCDKCEERLLNISITPVYTVEKEINNILLMYYDNTEKARAESELKKVLNKLQEKDRIISEDLSMAKRLQNNIITLSCDNDKLDINVHFEPMIEVGGDIYDVFEIRKDIIRVFIADATGHGVQAALTTMLLKAEYDKIKIFELESGKLLEIFNNSFFDNYYNLTVFFTCFIADIDINNNRIEYSSAGHPDQYLINKEKELIELKAGGKMIGLIPNINYETRQIDFNKGEKLLLFTDGLFEQFNANKKVLGEERLKDIIDKYKNSKNGDLVKNIISDVKKWEYLESNDDVTLISVDNKIND